MFASGVIMDTQPTVLNFRYLNDKIRILKPPQVANIYNPSYSGD